MTIDTSTGIAAPLATTPQALWALGDYALMAEEVMAPLGPVLVASAGISEGDRVLDVAATRPGRFHPWGTFRASFAPVARSQRGASRSSTESARPTRWRPRTVGRFRCRPSCSPVAVGHFLQSYGRNLPRSCQGRSGSIFRRLVLLHTAKERGSFARICIAHGEGNH